METFGERVIRLAQRLTYCAEYEGYELNELFAACAYILYKAGQKEPIVREVVELLSRELGSRVKQAPS